MKLNLKRPLVFFDLETTGVQVGSDRIVEICLHKVMPDGTNETLVRRVRPVDANGQTMHIPEQTTAIHGISDTDVAGEPSFAELAPQLMDFIADADLAGFNSNRFDVPLLVEEFLRAGVDFDLTKRHLVDVQNIFHKMEQRTLKAAYRFYCDKDLENAHSAAADTIATCEVLMAQLDRYQDADYTAPDGTVVPHPVVNDVEALSRFSTAQQWADLVGHIAYDAKHRMVINFGKHKGKTLEQVFSAEPAYYDWMMKADFPLSTKRVLRQAWQQHRQQLKLEALKDHFGSDKKH
ncbi:MAG: 3'-5' exonuclease [Bacteroidales bacterium]|nr:3'-5' exonuclease [Bacteroidales bacterium]